MFFSFLNICIVPSHTYLFFLLIKNSSDWSLTNVKKTTKTQGLPLYVFFKDLMEPEVGEQHFLGISKLGLSVEQ